MDIPVKVIRRETQKAIQVVLDEYPYLIIWVPRSALKAEYRAGERDVCVGVRDCGWARAFSEEQWAREVQKGMWV